jgi:hypothetical protein
MRSDEMMGYIMNALFSSLFEVPIPFMARVASPPLCAFGALGRNFAFLKYIYIYINIKAR